MHGTLLWLGRCWLYLPTHDSALYMTGSPWRTFNDFGGAIIKWAIPQCCGNVGALFNSPWLELFLLANFHIAHIPVVFLQIPPKIRRHYDLKFFSCRFTILFCQTAILVVGFVCGTVLWSYANSLCAKLILVRGLTIPKYISVPRHCDMGFLVHKNIVHCWSGGGWVRGQVSLEVLKHKDTLEALWLWMVLKSCSSELKDVVYVYNKMKPVCGSFLCMMLHVSDVERLGGI